jgi:hypothetical protein
MKHDHVDANINETYHMDKTWLHGWYCVHGQKFITYDTEIGWHCVHVWNPPYSCYRPWKCNSTLLKMIHCVIPYVLSTFFLIIMVNYICANNFIHEHNFVHVEFSLFLFIICTIYFVHNVQLISSILKLLRSNFIHMGNQLTKGNTIFGIWKPCE